MDSCSGEQRRREVRWSEHRSRCGCDPLRRRRRSPRCSPRLPNAPASRSRDARAEPSCTSRPTGPAISPTGLRLSAGSRLRGTDWLPPTSSKHRPPSPESCRRTTPRAARRSCSGDLARSLRPRAGTRFSHVHALGFIGARRGAATSRTCTAAAWPVRMLGPPRRARRERAAPGPRVRVPVAGLRQTACPELSGKLAGLAVLGAPTTKRATVGNSATAGSCAILADVAFFAVLFFAGLASAARVADDGPAPGFSPRLGAASGGRVTPVSTTSDAMPRPPWSAVSDSPV